MKTTINTFARIAIALLFIVTGIFKILCLDQLPISEPLMTDPVFAITIAVELGGGLLLLLGYKVKYVIPILIGFLTIITAMHLLPIISGSEKISLRLVAVLTNFAIIGGLGMLRVNGAGVSFSLPLTSNIDDIPIYNVKL